MACNIIYKSKLAPYIKGFLSEKEQKGLLTSDRLRWVMREFDRFYIEHEIEDVYIKEETIDKWRATRKNDCDRNIYNKYLAWIHLARYMCALGVDCYIPRLPKKGKRNQYVPCIFTHKEIQEIFFTADKLRVNHLPHRSPMFVIPAICRLLYSTGIRVGEALAIKNKDIDFEKRVIYINGLKNDQQRLAVINETLLAVLLQYKEFRDRIPINNILLPDHPFFINQLGKPCTKGNIGTWMSKVFRYSRVVNIVGRNSPRVHDFRHTSAVHSMIKLVKNEVDIYCALPMISTFLGHKNIRSTEMYVRLTQEMYPDILKVDSVTTSLFPQIMLNNDANI